MIEFYLKPGDLIITDRTYGVLISNSSGTWVYMSRGHSHPTPEWYRNTIRSRDLYYHLDNKTLWANVVYAPGKRRKRKKRST